MCFHGRKCGEDVRAAISKCQESDPCHALAHAENTGEGAEVDAEKVTRCDTDGAK